MSVLSPLTNRATHGLPPNVAQRSQALRSLKVKQEAVAQVCANQLPLFVAAARFQAVNPGVLNGEELCRNVIGWVHLALRDRPEQAEAVSARLESELQEHLNSFGVIRLPSAV
jgi:hypothetical protein